MSQTIDLPLAARCRVLRAQPLLLLCLLLILAGGLRWFRIGHESLWLDEFISLEDSTGRGKLHDTLPRGVIIDPAPALTRLSDGPGFAAIWSSLAIETHPPLYYLLLNIWRHSFGEGDVSARSFSLAMSLVAIVLVYFVAKLLHGPVPALWACLIMAVAGPQIHHAQEARSYPLTLALMLAAALALLRIEKLGVTRWRLAGLGAAMLAMALTHYLTVAAIVGLGLYALIRLSGRTRRDTLLTFLAAGIIFAVCWGPFFFEQTRVVRHEHRWMLGTPATEGIVPTLARLAILPLRWFTEPMRDSQGVGSLGAIIFLLPLLLLKRRPDLLLWSLLLWLPVMQIAIADIVRDSHALVLVRYTFLATAPAYALVAAMLAHKTGWLRHALPLAISVSCLAALDRAYARWQADWREPAGVFAGRSRPGEVLLIYKRTDDDWPAASQYLALSHYAPPPGPMMLIGDPPSTEAAARLRQAPGVWLISLAEDVPLARLLPGAKAIAAFDSPFTGRLAKVELRPAATAGRLAGEDDR